MEIFGLSGTFGSAEEEADDDALYLRIFPFPLAKQQLLPVHQRETKYLKFMRLSTNKRRKLLQTVEKDMLLFREEDGKDPD